MQTIPYSVRVIFIVLLLFAMESNALHAKESRLQFVTNGTQWPDQVHYKADIPGGSVFLTKSGFTYGYYSMQDINRIHELKHKKGFADPGVRNAVVHEHAYRVTMVGCNNKPLISPQGLLPNYYNYFLGNDATKWSGGMAAYSAIHYKDIYRDIDLNVYSKGTAMEYDFLVAPGADPGTIAMAYDGVLPKLTGKGDLLITTSVNEVLEQAPYAYQVINGVKTKVPCQYSLHGNTVQFSFPSGYDHTLELVIDPVLIFATYSGSTATVFGWSATYDAAGNLYAGGESFGFGWPTTLGAFQTFFSGQVDVGINKYSSNGTSLIYSTYYGGNNGDYPNNMIVDGSSNELVMAGATYSTNLPTTTGCFDNSPNGNADLYVVRFNSAGTALIGSTYVGGAANEATNTPSGELFVDTTGSIFVASHSGSANFPVTTGAYQTGINGPLDAVVFKLNRTCTTMQFATYLGGIGSEFAIGLKVNSAGNVVVGGSTTSNNFPGVSGGWQSTFQNSGPTPTNTSDGFIATLNPTGTALVSATYVGTTGIDYIVKIQLDANDNVYAMGVNGGLFPVSSGVYSVPNGKIFFAKFNPGLSNLLLSTTIGSSSVQTIPTSFLLDYCGNLYYVGYGASSGLPLTTNAYQTSPSGFWMCVLTPNMAALNYASYFGQPGDHLDGGTSRMDPHGIVYHSICTISAAQPTTPGVYCPTKLSNSYDIASWKFDFGNVNLFAAFDPGNNDTFCAPATIHFTNNSIGGLSYKWTFGDGSPNSTLATPPPHTYTAPGLYRIGLYAYNATSCLGVDSVFHKIYIRLDSVKAAAALTTNDSGCIPYSVAFANTTTNATSYDWIWGDGTQSTGISPTHTYNSSGNYTILFIAHNPQKCRSSDTLLFHVTALDPGPHADFSVVGKDSLCLPAVVNLLNQATNATDYTWDFGDGTVPFIGSNPPPHIYQDTGTFIIKLIAYNHSNWVCVPSDTTTRPVHVFHLAAPLLSVNDVLVCAPDDTAAITVKIDSQFVNTQIAWQPVSLIYTNPTLADVLVNSRHAQSFNVTVTNNLGDICSRSASATVNVKPVQCDECLYMPNAFTPNHDGHNDGFGAVTRCPVTHYNFAVYNRWGQQMFTGFYPEAHWDGTYNSKPMPLGTYFYKYSYQAIDGRTITGKGDFTLIR